MARSVRGQRAVGAVHLGGRPAVLDHGELDRRQEQWFDPADRTDGAVARLEHGRLPPVQGGQLVRVYAAGVTGLPQPLARHGREQFAKGSLEPGSDVLCLDHRCDRRGPARTDTAQLDRGRVPGDRRRQQVVQDRHRMPSAAEFLR
ncbi:hypothetical protein ADK64_29735 [Streptomyces sp. MMG1121]|nr:hypothetical protein ADK64_29735 [Streptomyces sp. MMG1121]